MFNKLPENSLRGSSLRDISKTVRANLYLLPVCIALMTAPHIALADPTPPPTTTPIETPIPVPTATPTPTPTPTPTLPWCECSNSNEHIHFTSEVLVDGRTQLCKFSQKCLKYEEPPKWFRFIGAEDIEYESDDGYYFYTTDQRWYCKPSFDYTSQPISGRFYKSSLEPANGQWSKEVTLEYCSATGDPDFEEMEREIERYRSTAAAGIDEESAYEQWLRTTISEDLTESERSDQKNLKKPNCNCAGGADDEFEGFATIKFVDDLAAPIVCIFTRDCIVDQDSYDCSPKGGIEPYIDRYYFSDTERFSERPYIGLLTPWSYHCRLEKNGKTPVYKDDAVYSVYKTHYGELQDDFVPELEWPEGSEEAALFEQ